MSYQQYLVPLNGYENSTQLCTGLGSMINAIWRPVTYEVEGHANNSVMYDNVLYLVFIFLYYPFNCDMYLARMHMLPLICLVETVTLEWLWDNQYSTIGG